MSERIRLRLISPEGESLLALPKSNQKASPYCPPDPPVLALCGMLQRPTNACYCYAECVPTTHLPPHNAARFGAGKRGGLATPQDN